jgi:hypothetical protein
MTALYADAVAGAPALATLRHRVTSLYVLSRRRDRAR